MFISVFMFISIFIFISIYIYIYIDIHTHVCVYVCCMHVYHAGLSRSFDELLFDLETT